MRTFDGVNLDKVNAEGELLIAPRSRRYFLFLADRILEEAVRDIDKNKDFILALFRVVFENAE